MVDDIVGNPERGFIHPTAVKTSNGQELFLLLVTKRPSQLVFTDTLIGTLMCLLAEPRFEKEMEKREIQEGQDLC